jgi:hypothetical protein
MVTTRSPLSLQQPHRFAVGGVVHACIVVMPELPAR